MEDIPLDLKLKIMSLMNDGKGISVDSRINTLDLLTTLDSSRLDASLVSKEEIEKLNAEGFIIKDGFLGKDICEQIRRECEGFLRSGVLQPGGMGKGETQWNQSRIRGDVIAWLRPNEVESEEKKPSTGIQSLGKNSLTSSSILSLLNRLDDLKSNLNSSISAFNCTRVSIQLACYPSDDKGRTYTRHFDSFPGGPNRRLTAIYYVNPEWKEADGGQLRMYLENDKGFRDIDPIGDRLVIFVSSRMEHEVMPSFSERYAITHWLY
eukprot:TRINITY_DN9853_c0_g1_i1.p1 TRINITY_DN9853_c0_g1~~TRINITY_DN9853_c0_g1_i1.p1  ORF type:complete len:265 (-),score=67.43 TRINITY_DN9853_c0_g1_i1:46-840(-)